MPFVLYSKCTKRVHNDEPISVWPSVRQSLYHSVNMTLPHRNSMNSGTEVLLCHLYRDFNLYPRRFKPNRHNPRIS